MPRRKRVHYFEAFYHVMMRGNYRQNIFIDDKDRYYFYQLLERAVTQFDCRIHLFCLMNNHIHLVIEVKQIPLWRIIQSIAPSYAKYMNKRTGRMGHLFQGRYKEKLIENERYMLELCRYIHLNPLSANMVDNIDLYPWSSHLCYREKKYLSWLTLDYVKKILIKWTGEGLDHYLDFINKKDYPRNHCEFDAEGLLILKNNTIRKLQYRKSFNFSLLSLEKIIEIICGYMKVDVKEIASQNLERKICLTRSLITYFAYYYAHYNLNEIAILLCKKSDTLNKALRRHLILKSTKDIICELENLLWKLQLDSKKYN